MFASAAVRAERIPPFVERTLDISLQVKGRVGIREEIGGDGNEGGVVQTKGLSGAGGGEGVEGGDGRGGGEGIEGGGGREISMYMCIVVESE